MAIDSLELDEDGYPTEESLEAITGAVIRSREDCTALLEAVRAIWHLADGYWSQVSDVYMVSTAGWSGNESIIEALQQNHMFWGLCWESHRRGGHYTFIVKGLTP